MGAMRAEINYFLSMPFMVARGRRTAVRARSVNGNEDGHLGDYARSRAEDTRRACTTVPHRGEGKKRPFGMW